MNPNPCRGQPARERLMKAAAELFYSQGIAATGSIDPRQELHAKASIITSPKTSGIAYIQAAPRVLDLYELQASKAESPRAWCWQCSMLI